MMQTTISARGEVVIPKGIRDHLGLSGTVILDVREDAVTIKRAERDVVLRCKQRALKYSADVSKWVMGDKLYEEIFQ